MGKKTALHEAAERGDSDSLQRLLDEGTYDVNEENDEWQEFVRFQIREGIRMDLLTFPSHPHTALNYRWYAL